MVNARVVPCRRASTTLLPMDDPIQVALFDLDGTISDSGQGIINGIKFALNKIDVRVPEDHDWVRYLGPPLRDCFVDFLGLPDDEVDAAIDAYVEYYRNGGMYENELYPGIPGLLDALHEAGLTMAVATSKRRFMADGILEHFGLRSNFAAVGGADPDGANGRKHEVIERMLEQLGVEHDDRCHVVMIGDREHDILGASGLGLRTIGVRWGYAEPGELERAGADDVVDTIDELRSLLLPR